MGWADAPIVSAPNQPAWMNAPVIGKAPDDGQSSFMGRVKNAIIAPPNERDASFSDAVYKGVTGIPAAISKDFNDSAAQFSHISPEEASAAVPRTGVPAELSVAGLAAKPVMSAIGMALSPVTGTLKSLVGRPVEQVTGVRRGITGDVLSAAVPFGGEANIANDAAKAQRATSALKPMAIDAHAAGYVLPPQMISDKPGLIANTLSAWSGKIKTAQAASAKNQEVTNALAAKSLGLPDGTELVGNTFKAIRAEAGKAYSAIPAAVPQIKADEEYLNTVASLGRPGAEAAQRAFPNTTKNPGIIDLQDELTSVKDFPTSAGLEIVKELRSQATANLKAFSDPSKQALGSAQKRAADAVDDLIQRNVEATGNTDLVKAYRDARVKIAKSYDVEGATNLDTGNVNAHAIAKLAAKGRPLTDELATIAKVAHAFPKAMQSAEKFGDVEPWSVLDAAGAAAAATHGNVGLAAGVVARPLVRKAVLSGPMQGAMTSGAAAAVPSGSLRRAPAVNALQQLLQEPQN